MSALGKLNHYTKSQLQDRTIDRLRDVKSYWDKYSTLPIGNTTMVVPERYRDTRNWLTQCIRKHEKNVTTPLRAALVKLGAVSPRGDEERFELALPDFLRGADTHVDELMARQPKTSRRSLTPNPFAGGRPSGGHSGSPFT